MSALPVVGPFSSGVASLQTRNGLLATFVLWSSLNKGELQRIQATARVMGKVEGRMWGRFLTNARKGLGTAFYIDATGKENALRSIGKAKPFPGIPNVYYCGKIAESLIRQSTG